jgi:hypothetical protein
VFLFVHQLSFLILLLEFVKNVKELALLALLMDLIVLHVKVYIFFIILIVLLFAQLDSFQLTLNVTLAFLLVLHALIQTLTLALNVIMDSTLLTHNVLLLAQIPLSQIPSLEDVTLVNLLVLPVKIHPLIVLLVLMDSFIINLNVWLPVLVGFFRMEA